MNSSTILDFFVTNWHNALSLILSLAALVVAIQANIYAKRNSTPTISIKDNYERKGQKSTTDWRLNIQGHYRKSTRAYELILRAPGEFWITNSGGINSTLVDVSFVIDVDRVLENRFRVKWYTEIHEHKSPHTKGDILFDLNISSGATVPVYVTATSYPVTFQTKEEALKFADDLVIRYSAFSTSRWYFRFGDGTTLVRSNKKMTFSTGNLENNLDTSCEE
jgi:hypothetical protein